MERLGQALERECGQSIERTRVWVWVCVERGGGEKGDGGGRVITACQTGTSVVSHRAN